jgi:hypothetical protein
MDKHQALEYLRARLKKYQTQQTDMIEWIGHIGFGRRTDIEITIADRDGEPSEDHLAHAAECVAGLQQLLPELEAALNTVEDSALIPPRPRRQWYLEWLTFAEPTPARGEAGFTLDLPEAYDYIYVTYSVEIVNAHAGRANVSV